MTAERRVREERELHDAFAPLRPDPAAFLAEVERRIAERGGVAVAEEPGSDVSTRDGDGEADALERVDARPLERTPLWRTAAGLLPPGFLPTSVLSSTLGLSAKKLTWKAAPALLALPAICVLMLVVTFAAALTQVARLDSSRPASPFLEREEIRAWWWRNRVLAVLTFVGLAALFWLRPSDALVALLLASIGALALILRSLSAAGFASRRAVGTKCAQLCWSLGFYAALFGAQGSVGGFLHAIPRSAAWIFFAGALVCVWAAWEGKPLRALRERGHMAASVLILLHLAPLLALAAWPLLRGRLDADDLREHVETTRFERGIDFSPAVRAALWLKAKGVDVDTTGLRSYLEANNALGDDWIACFRLGLVSSDELRERGYSPTASSWRRFGLGRDPAMQRFEVTTDANPYVLAASGEMTEAERETLVRRALAYWPEDDEWMPLDPVSGVVALLDTLDAPEAFDARVPDLHALLERLWLGTTRGGDGPAGFVPKRPYEFRKSNELSTLRAVQLMARFGVPEGVDVRRVRLELEHAATRRALWRAVPLPATIDAATALDVVRTRFPDSRGTLVRRLLEQRVLVGVVLLVVFCCVASLRAPVRDRKEGD